MSAVASEIASQIGSTSFAMMGTNQIVRSEKALIFNVKGCWKWKKIKVTLDGDDTYIVEFFQIGSSPNFKVSSQRFDGVYCDGLKSLIEQETGLLLSL